MGKKAKSNAGKKKALDRKIDKSTLPPPPPKPEDEVCHELMYVEWLQLHAVMLSCNDTALIDTLIWSYRTALILIV